MAGVGLTHMQRRLLSYVDSYMSSTGGVGPSLAECAKALGLKSRTGVIRLRDALIERGHMRVRSNLARAMEVVRPEPLVRAPVSIAPDGAPLIFIPVDALPHPEPRSGRTGPGEATMAPPALF